MLRRILVLALLVLVACQPVEPPRIDDTPSALRRADSAFARADYEAAVGLYSAFLHRDPPEDLVPQASYKLALSHYRLKQYDDAKRVLGQLRASDPEGQYPQVLTLYGDIDAAEARNISALLWWEQAWHIATPAAQGQLSVRVNDLAPKLSDDERNRAREMVHTEAILRALEARPRSTTPAVAQRSAAPTPTLVSSKGAARIGVLLPTSGRYATLGQQSLEGIQLAVADPQMLVLRDTAETQGGDLAAFEALARDPDVIAVIGPLRSDAAAAVAPRAKDAGVPLLLLSQRDGLAGPGVFDFGMTRRMQSDALAHWAVEVRGLTHLGIANPDDAYGADFRDAFAQAITATGGRLLGGVTYSGEPISVERAVKELQAWDARTRLDAVFVPDGADVVARIAPRLRETLPSVQLLGTSAWNDPAALRGAAMVLAGSVFADGFYAESTRPATRAFVDQFRYRYGRRPGVIEAQAFDAASLLASMVGRGIHSRTEMRAAIADAGNVAGAAGDLQIRAGVVRRALFLLQVADDGSVVELR